MRHIRIRQTRKFRCLSATIYRIDGVNDGYPHYCSAPTFAAAAAYVARVFL